MIGRSFSHYRISETLGSGGMGTVFRAEDTLLGRKVALKFPHRSLVNDPDARTRFLREARVASVLDHPNIVVLYDVCEAEGEVFLAMQCVEGRSLRERLAQGPVPVPEALAIGRGVADALAHAHGRGIVHRDVKPENILLCEDGRVKVADFGTALILGESRVTRTGAVVGTVSYMAPEVVTGATADARSDLYSLGAVLYELVAGRPPFRGEQAAAILYQVVHEEAPPLGDAAAAAPGLDGLVRALLAKSPEKRPPSAVAVSDALKAILEGRTAPVPPATGVSVPARSIAVLYFENLTGNAEDDYFCAGMTEDLLTALLKVPDLKVASRNSVAALRGKPVDMKQAGKDLGVATVLEGSVRRAGGRVRVTAQLIRADTGYHIWAERYDRSLEDIFEVQDDISRRIADALRLALEPEDPETRLGRRTRSTKAYDLRLQAMALYHRFEDPEMRKAIELLTEAVREDPQYALGHADLAECMIQLVCKEWDHDLTWLDRAEVEARKALEIAPELPEGHRTAGHVLVHKGRLERALLDFHHAVDLDPRLAGALNSLGVIYMTRGDYSRAELYLRRAIDGDPADPRPFLVLATICLRMRRYAEARELAERMLAQPAGRFVRVSALEDLLLSHVYEGDLEGARRVAGQFEKEFPDDSFAHSLRALAAAADGRRDEAEGLLARCGDIAELESGTLLNHARTRMVLGDREAALRLVETYLGLSLHDVDAVVSDPHLSGLRGDPRFDALAVRKT